MPPKRKKSTPVVVGTVSTRSTRRESIVNIEIIPKSNKVTKQLPLQKNTTKKLLEVTDRECEADETMQVKSLEETRPEILEILKDWSDDESSQDCNILSFRASSSSSALASDQQSLIDILEGKQCDTQDVSFEKTSKGKHVLIDNVVVDIDSPKVGESEIIEECVVEDENIIIVIPEDQSEDNGNTGKDGANIETVTEDHSYNEKNQMNSSVKDNLPKGKLSHNLKRNNEKDGIQSVVSEDVSQKEQEEFVSNSTEIHTSDNSITNFEVIEEHIESDNYSEVIIVDNLETASAKHSSKNEQRFSTKTENSKLLDANMTPFCATNKKSQVDSDEINLCHKVKESMNISQKSNSKPSDHITKALQYGISNIAIKNEEEIYSDSRSANSESGVKFAIKYISPVLSGNKKNKKALLSSSSSSSVSPKVSPDASLNVKNFGKTDIESAIRHVRRSTRKKAPEDERQHEHDYSGQSAARQNNTSHSELDQIQKDKNVETSISHLERCEKSKSALIEGGEAMSKSRPNKNQPKDENKMDVDSESSETKSSELDGDSTSNESSQNQTSSKPYKANRKDSSNASLDESLLSSHETSISAKDSDMDTAQVIVNKKSPKGSKSKIKKLVKNEAVGVASAPKLDDSIEILRSEIDATIDEVLRKYTCEDSDSSKDHDVKNLSASKDSKMKSSKDAKKKKDSKSKKEDKNTESSEEVRRSDRIKTILPVKKKSHGLVRSKSESLLFGDAENSDSSSVHNDSDKPTPSASPQLGRVDKAKSRSKSTDNLHLTSVPDTPDLPKVTDMKSDKSGQAEIEARLKTFTHLKENQYKTDRQVCKEAREMICDCYLAEEDIQNDEYGCGEDCLNRLLMIECGHLCQVGDRCTNKRFQKSMFAPVEVFKTEKKGLGLRAAANIAYGEFILEYIGEVLDPDEFDKRAEVYSKDKNIHFYFMSLRADAIIDATMKGNISRFINHSCDPNAETQKWTVNGELRIGFFSTRTILAGEEITFDYHFQRYGKEAQKCYCEAAICRGWLGERPDESEDEEEEEEEEPPKVSVEVPKPHIKVSPEIPAELSISKEESLLSSEKVDSEITTATKTDVVAPDVAPVATEPQETPKKVIKKKPRKELLYEDFDQLNGDIEMLVTTGLKNQAHTLKLSRLMVRAKDLEQRKKLLRVLRRGELPCRRLFLDYHGLRLMHGYMIDAQQLASADTKVVSSMLEIIQTKLELLQTLAVLPIQNKTMLIESKVLPAVEKWAKNEDIIEDGDQREEKKRSLEKKNTEELDPAAKEKIDEIKFLASKLLEEWVNLKESFRIPKKQRIEQMKEHEKEANRKFMESSYAQEKESSRKHDQRYRTWSRYKSERENKKSSRFDDKDRPSAEFLKISKHERRKLFALQMELKEEERRMKQREMWRQHEMNCMMIGADPRFTAPFDPSKGFQYIWNPSLGQWQALPVPSAQNQGVFNSPASSQAVTTFNVAQPHKTHLLGPFPPSVISIGGMTGTAPQYPGLQSTLPPLVPGLTTSTPLVPGLTTSTMANSVPVISSSLPGTASNVPGMSSSMHGLPGSITGISGSLPGINQPPLSALPIYQDVKQEDPSQVKFAGPIPPPAKLPPKWKCAKDKYGRPYYYHVKIRKSQWEPPPFPEPVIEDSSESSTSDSSSGSSSDSSSDSDADDEIEDARLLLEIRKQMESTSKLALKSAIPDHIKKEGKDSVTPSPEIKGESDIEDDLNRSIKEERVEHLSSIDIRLKEQFNLDSNDPPKKKRRTGLCQEIIISPRTEEDRKQFKEDLKRYKATKEKLKRQKEQMMLQAKKKLKTSSSTDDIIRKSRDKRSSKTVSRSRMKDMKEWNDEHAKKIKEVFRSTMATTVVGVLNAYRKPDCKEARITNTEDFKHLARKLTHFVMLKEIKHIASIDDLVCSDNVKSKAREYIRKYMSKFGEVYQKRQDEPDFKD